MNEELSKKLAEWAGFSWHKQRQYVHGELMHGGSWEEGHWDYQGECWYEMADGTPDMCFGEGQLPNFTESLDACFKWLVPELLSRGYYVEIIQGEVDDATCHLHTNLDKPEFLTYAEKPALALCLAIEQLKGND